MRIKELDGLRGVAVLAVIDRHFLTWLPQSGSVYGWLGVDLFFVLSGFLITSILLGLRNEERYFTIFYSRRALRIFPPYFLGLAVYLIISFAMGMPGSWKMWLSYLFYYSSLVNTHPTFAGPAAVPIYVAHGLAVLWSLSVEEVYYTVWAPIVRFTGSKTFVAILLAMIVVAPVLRWVLHTPHHEEIVTFYCRMDGLAFGSAVALLIRSRKTHQWKWEGKDRLIGFMTVSFLTIAAIFLLWTGGDPSSLLICGLGVTVANISFALVVHQLVVHSGGKQLWVRIFRAKWLRSIGMVSYSLYLFHWPVYFFSTHIVAELHVSSPRIRTACEMLLALGLTFGIAYGLWYGMESRILNWKDRRIPSPARPEAPEAQTMATVQ